MQSFPLPPKDINQLQQRAGQLAGKTIGQLAQSFNCQPPQNLKIQKGWQGQFLEQCLGADSGNLSQPDFNHLGIELKTLPVDLSGRVEESTYVCVLNLMDHQLMQWQQSAVFKKLNHVLWVPIAKSKHQDLASALVGSPFLWQPNPNEMQLLKNDWEHVMNLVSLGQVDKLNARLGEVLQVRPKAAHSRITTSAFGREGETIKTLPRGFYLRSSFTQSIINYSLKLA
jgi:DNA mismatch repair protein MutH